jgi:L-lactate dehydrogenase (cytochrome)/(S)-mandelate dehydrogenase
MAMRCLPAGLYEFIDRGAEDEVTMRENSESIKRILFRQRIGIDVSKRDISTTLFGVKQSMPIGIGVTAFSGLMAYDGERKLARAAAAIGVPYTLGCFNMAAQADLKPICGDLLWRQLYIPKRRDLLDHHVRLSREIGIRVLVVTMDSPVMGNREYMQRSGMNPRSAPTLRAVVQALKAPHWCFGTFLRYALEGGLPNIADLPKDDPNIPEARFFLGKLTGPLTADDFSWDDLRALRRQWSDILVVKGVSTAEDAKIAVDCGADGVIVSNHGGRSLDGCVPSMGMLREVVDAVAHKVPVMIDGGFKRGADVLKAIALGASTLFVGRATLFGLAAAGEPGATKALTIFRDEISRALALVGCRNLSELGRDHLLT